MKVLLQISAFLYLAATLFLTQSCIKAPAEFPLEPRISYKAHELVENLDDETGLPNGKYTLKMYLDFTDGDGDIGLDQGDTTGNFKGDSIYYYNFYAKYYEKINGEFTQLTPQYPWPLGDTIHYNGRIPLLTPPGKQKSIKGEIQYDIDMDRGPLKSKTIKLGIYIYDRSLHKSNEIETPEITFP